MPKSRNLATFSVRNMAIAGLIAALYAVLSYFSGIFGMTFGPIQIRFSEALCVLPFFFPAAVPGLAVGCLVTNLLSPYGALDIVFGTLATTLAALRTARCRRKWLAPLPPVVCNALIIPAVIAVQTTTGIEAFAAAYVWNAVTIGLGEAVACYALGGILLQRFGKIYTPREYIG